MRSIHSLMVLILLALFSCNCNTIDPDPDDPDPDPNATITLDELLDMEVYKEGWIVDCRYYKEERISRIVLNDSEHKSPVSLDLSQAGYYRMEIFTGTSGSERPGVIRLVVLDPERGQTEWGLPPWTPAGVEIENLGDQEVRLIFPASIPAGFSYPLVVIIGGELTKSLLSVNADLGDQSFLIKRGVGSAWVPSGENSPATLDIDYRSFPLETEILEGPPLLLGGTLNENTVIPSGSYVSISEDLSIPTGTSLTIEAGVFVAVDPEVNIYNDGSLLINGTAEAPVTVTCSDEKAFWGGVIGRSDGNHVEASHSIFSRSGFHAGGEYDWGHAHRQALFYTEKGSLSLDHCYMIDHIGQLLYPVSATVDLEQCLIQRARTGGQLNSTRVTINESVFTDFPDDSQDYRDSDNDGLYLMTCVADISNSIFMYAKDDGLDSGGGTEGEVRVNNCRFESTFHEGAALSGGSGNGKNQTFTNCIFQDCGQGLELGYSSRIHFVEIESCQFIRNGVGIRYGDCYEYPNNGYMTVSNSESLDNLTHDVWNMDREDWIADTSHMEFSNVWVSKANPMYPELKIRE